MGERPTDRGRCHVGVVGLNAITVLLAVLDLPLALTAPMNIGMTEGAAGHRVVWAEAVGGLAMLYPLIAGAGVFLSVRSARSHRHDNAVLCAIAPYFVVTPLITLVVLYW